MLIYLAIFPSFSFFLSFVEAKEDKSAQITEAEEVVISSPSEFTPNAVNIDSELKLCSSGVQLDDDECDYYNCVESYDFDEGDRVYFTIQYTTDYWKTISRRIDYPDGTYSTDSDYYFTSGSFCLDGYEDLAYDKGDGNAYFTVTIKEDFPGNTRSSVKQFTYSSCVDECNILMQGHWYCDPLSIACSPYSEEWFCDYCDSDPCLDKCDNKCCSWGCEGNGYFYRCAAEPQCSFSSMECGNQCINLGYAMAQCSVGTCPSGWTNIGDYGCVGNQDCDRCCCLPPTTSTTTTVPTTTTTIPNLGRCEYDSYPQIVCPDCDFAAGWVQVLYTGDTMDTASAISPIVDKVISVWYYDGVTWYVYAPSLSGTLDQLTYNHCYAFNFDSAGTWTTHPDCNDYCYGDILYHNGWWSGTECVWSMKVCPYGCFNAECVEQNAFPFKLYIENNVPGTVYKQPGDYVSLIVSSYNAQTINLNFDPALIYVSGPISGGQVDAIAGDVEIKFKISEDASPKTYSIQGDNGDTTDSVSFKVITDPDIIIITDGDALIQRFGETEGTSSILQQAQTLANSKRGVLYDLKNYRIILGDRPWTSFSAYYEKPLSPYKKDNIYSNNLAEFIQKKCTDCGEVMIIGDDFVVPYYRVDYQWYSKEWWDIFGWWGKTETEYIYSDTNYIPREIRPVGDIDNIINEVNQEKGEKVIIIKPDGTSYSELNELKQTLYNNYDIAYSNMPTKESSEITCNSYSDLEEQTLILIGNRENNNAIKCVPWFEQSKKPTDTFNASITVERNVWGGDNYAIILSGDDEGKAIETLNEFLINPSRYELEYLDEIQTLYVYEFSAPPELVGFNDMVQAYGWGKCEYIGDTLEEQAPCITSDIALSVAPVIGIIGDSRDVINYCFGGKKDGMTTLICGASTAGLVLSVDDLTGVGLIDQVGDVFLAATKRVTKSLAATLRNSEVVTKILKVMRVTDESSMRKFFKVATNDELLEKAGKYSDEMTNLIGYTKKTRGLTGISEFSETTLKAGIKNVDDLDDVAFGAEKLLRTGLIETAENPKLPINMLDDLPLSTQVHKIDFTKSLGRSMNRLGATDDTLKGIRFVNEEKVIRYLPDEDIIEISKNFDVDPNFISFGQVTGHALPQEYCHAIMKKNLGKWTGNYITSVPYDDVPRAINAYDDFLADVLQKQKLVGEFDLFEFVSIDDIAYNLELRQNYDAIAYIRAYAIKTGSDKLPEINALLTGDVGNVIKTLSNKFVDNSLENLVAMSEVARKQVLDDIALDTIALMAMEGV